MIYRVFDLAGMLAPGENVLAVHAGGGWHVSPIVRCQVELDGEVVAKTRPFGFLCGPSAITRNSIYGGEEYDARLELDSGWMLPGGPALPPGRGSCRVDPPAGKMRGAMAEPIRELMELIDQAKDIQEQIDSTFTHAYKCLQHANIEHGISLVSQLAYTVPIEDSIKIKSRSIMGTEIPLVDYTPDENQPTYSFSTTDESIDRAREAFRKVKELTIKLSMIENAAYRLATNIKKTQKRANALKNITIPTYTTLVSSISNALEEKEREEFTRLKVIKQRKI